MSPESFGLWLRGFMDGIGDAVPTEAQVKTIRERSLEVTFHAKREVLVKSDPDSTPRERMQAEIDKAKGKRAKNVPAREELAGSPVPGEALPKVVRMG